MKVSFRLKEKDQESCLARINRRLKNLFEQKKIRPTKLRILVFDLPSEKAFSKKRSALPFPIAFSSSLIAGVIKETDQYSFIIDP